MTDRVAVGRVGRPHGVDGSFFVELPSDDPAWFARGSTLIVGGEPAEVVVSKRGSGGRPVIKLDREVQRGAPIEVAREALPEPEEGEYYVFQLLGAEVTEEGGRALGKVTTVTPGVANDVLELDSGLALPMVEECVLDIDVEAGRILVAPGFSHPD